MILFRIKDQYIDLPADFDVSMAYNNSIFAFEKMQLSRTTEFVIPGTPRNEKIFGYAGSASSSGDEIRRAYDLDMYYDGGVKPGILHITNYKVGDGYSAVFIWGELVSLQAMTAAGTIDKYMADDDTNIKAIHSNVINADGFSFFNFKKYKNGVADAQMLLTKMNLSPCVGLSSLLESALTKQGLNVDFGAYNNALDSIKVILAGNKQREANEPLTISGVPNSGFGIVGNYSDYFELVNLTYKWVEVGFFWDTYHNQTVKGFRAKADIIIKFTSSSYFPTWTLVTGATQNDFLLGSNNGVNNYIQVGKTLEIKAGSSFSFLSGNDFGVGTGGQWVSNFGSAISAIFTVEYKNQSTVEHNTDYYLSENLPKITATDIMKTFANLLHCGIDYNAATATVSFFNFNFNRAQAIDLTGKVIQVKTVDRKFMDYSNKNKVDFKSEEYVLPGAKVEISYTIDNDFLKDEKILYSVPFSEGNVDALGNVVLSDFDLSKDPPQKTAKQNTICLIPPDGGVYLRHIGEFETRFAVPKYLDAIISKSTTVIMDVKISQKDFLAIKNTNCYQYNGIYYALISATFKNGTAEFSLVKI